MANDVVAFNPAQLPSFARKRGDVSALTKALAGKIGGGGYPYRISIKGGVFRLLAEGKEIASIDERFLDVVIVGAAPKIYRTFYAKKYAENEASAPVCWSSDGNTPDKSVSERQSNACATCEQNVRGSGDNDTRACRFQQRVAVVLANDMEGSVMQLILPAKSVFGKEESGNFPMQAYARWLATQNVEANEVITRLRFDTRESSPKLFFKAMRWLNDEEYAVVASQSETPAAQDAVKMDFVASETPQAPAPRREALPAPDSDDDAPAPASKAADTDDEPPAPAPRRGRPKKKAEASADDAGGDDATAEPTVRKTATPPAAPAREGVKSLVDKWDDED
jgi:hypothetical protein